MILILGAGLAGLSAAHHLRDRDVLVVERDADVGGLCRTERDGGFVFDRTGHLLHVRDADVRAWVEELLPDGWLQLKRSAWIASHGILTPYPFQANTAGLPVDVRHECLLGFVEALRHPRRDVPRARPIDPSLPHLCVAPAVADGEPSFHDWIHETFGAGFARHFFEPYNTKLWRRDLAEVTSDWVSWSIPRPDLADVLRGAFMPVDRAFGYNPEFLYPREGGIDRLPRALAGRLSADRLRTECPAARIEAENRRVTLGDGESIDAEVVLTSLPLPVLASITADLPDDLRRAADGLSWVSIRSVDIGLRGKPAHPEAQWVYVPDPEAPFHRVGFPCALTPAMAPDGHHSLTAEISVADDDPGRDAHLEDSLAALEKLGFVSDRDAVVHTSVHDIPHAYVVFDAARREVLPDLLRWFVERRIVPMGRYGSWDYLSMEDSLVHGRQVATWLTS